MKYAIRYSNRILLKCITSKIIRYNITPGCFAELSADREIYYIKGILKAPDDNILGILVLINTDDIEVLYHSFLQD